jgi:hypothetical protein
MIIQERKLTLKNGVWQYRMDDVEVPVMVSISQSNAIGYNPYRLVSVWYKTKKGVKKRVVRSFEVERKIKLNAGDKVPQVWRTKQ